MPLTADRRYVRGEDLQLARLGPRLPVLASKRQRGDDNITHHGMWLLDAPVVGLTVRAALGSLVFLVLIPGTMGGLIPWWITEWQAHPVSLTTQIGPPPVRWTRVKLI